MTVTIDHIRAAADVLAGKVNRTPSLRSACLSQISGAEVVLKLENLQLTGSFKVRGSLNKMASLDPSASAVGVIAASAGNHAQGVAYHARHLGIPAVIVMPKATPFTKVARTEALGATVELFGETFKDSQAYALEEADKRGMTYIHPYDDPAVIAGQGTIALEMLEEDPDLEVLIVPVGGGGLIAGIATAAKAVKPDITVIGVEVASYPAMYRALGGEAPPGGGATMAEGIAVKTPGELPKAIAGRLVDEMELVEESSLERSVQLFLEAQRIVVEGAGAASLAALLEHKDRLKGRKVGLIVSGGNIDSRLLASILMRGLVREGRLCRLRIEIPDHPGVLSSVSGIIGEEGGNIVEVYHQRLFYDVPVKEAELDVVLETVDAEHVCRVMDRLQAAGYPVRILGGSSTGQSTYTCQT